MNPENLTSQTINILLREGKLHIIPKEKWQAEIATKYGMLSALNQRGRHRKDV